MSGRKYGERQCVSLEPYNINDDIEVDYLYLPRKEVWNKNGAAFERAFVSFYPKMISLQDVRNLTPTLLSSFGIGRKKEEPTIDASLRLGNTNDFLLIEIKKGFYYHNGKRYVAVSTEQLTALTKNHKYGDCTFIGGEIWVFSPGIKNVSGSSADMVRIKRSRIKLRAIQYLLKNLAERAITLSVTMT